MDIRFEEYLKAVLECMTQKLDEDFSCQVIRGDTTGIVVKQGGQGLNEKPVSIDEYYKRFIDVEVAAGDIISHIIQAAKSNVSTKYKDVKDKLRIRLSGKRSGLNELLHASYLNLTIMFYAEVEDAAIVRELSISNERFRTWGKSFDDVYKQAVKNERKYNKPKIVGLVDAVQSVIAGTSVAGQKEPWYVVSNESHYMGASAILLPEILEKLEKLYDGDFLILPSSVHEVITIPVGQGNKRELKMTMKGIYESSKVKGIELTDTIYRYDRVVKKLKNFG